MLTAAGKHKCITIPNNTDSEFVSDLSSFISTLVLSVSIKVELQVKENALLKLCVENLSCILSSAYFELRSVEDYLLLISFKNWNCEMRCL